MSDVFDDAGQCLYTSAGFAGKVVWIGTKCAEEVLNDIHGMGTTNGGRCQMDIVQKIGKRTILL